MMLCNSSVVADNSAVCDVSEWGLLLYSVQCRSYRMSLELFIFENM